MFWMARITDLIQPSQVVKIQGRVRHQRYYQGFFGLSNSEPLYTCLSSMWVSQFIDQMGDVCSGRVSPALADSLSDPPSLAHPVAQSFGPSGGPGDWNEALDIIEFGSTAEQVQGLTQCDLK